MKKLENMTKTELIAELTKTRKVVDELSEQLGDVEQGTQRYETLVNGIDSAKEKMNKIAEYIRNFKTPKLPKISIPKISRSKFNARYFKIAAVMATCLVLAVGGYFAAPFVTNAYNMAAHNFNVEHVNGVSVIQPVNWEMKHDGEKVLSDWAKTFDVDTVIVGGTISGDEVIFETGDRVPLKTLISTIGNPAKAVSFLDNPEKIEIAGLKYTSKGNFQIYNGRHFKMGFIPSIEKTTIVKSSNFYGHLTDEGLQVKLDDWTMEDVSK